MRKLEHLRLGIMIPLMGVLLVAAVLAGAAWFTLGAGSQRIVKGVWIGDIPVGGMPKGQALRLVEERFAAFQSKPLFIRYDGRTWVLTPRQAGFTLNARSAVDKALAIGHRGPWAARLRDHWNGAARRKRLTLALRINTRLWMRYLSALEAEVNRPAISASVEWNGRDGSSIRPHQVGRQIEAEEFFRRVQTAAVRDKDREIALPVKVTTPALLTADLEAGDFSHLIVQYSTRFDEKDADRSYNVRIAAAAFSSFLIRPGEVVSFNSTVGPRVAEKGFRPAPVVLRGELVPDIGGGVCQVSSTLYNVVLLSGLKVVTKRSHSRPVPYVPLGRDATVSSAIDFRFENNTSAPLYLSTSVKDGTLTMRLMGPSRGNSWIRLSTKVIEEIPPGELLEVDASLAAEKRIVARPGAPGYVVELWREVYEGSKQVKRELVGRITYQPVAALVKVGPQSSPGEEHSRVPSNRVPAHSGVAPGSDR